MKNLSSGWDHGPLVSFQALSPGSPQAGNMALLLLSKPCPQALLGLGSWPSCFFPSLVPRLSSGWDHGPLASFQALSPGSPQAGIIALLLLSKPCPQALLRLGSWPSCFFPSLVPRLSSGWDHGPLVSFQALSPGSPQAGIMALLLLSKPCPQALLGLGSWPSCFFPSLVPRLSSGWEHGPLSSCARLAPRSWTMKQSYDVGWGVGSIHLFQNVRTVCSKHW